MKSKLLNLPIIVQVLIAIVMGAVQAWFMPVLATALGFTPGMQAVCLSLGVLLDAPLTAANVLCDGAVCVIVDRWAEGAMMNCK